MFQIIMIIKKNGGDDATDYLYHYDYGQSYKILLRTTAAGFLISLMLIFWKNKGQE